MKITIVVWKMFKVFVFWYVFEVVFIEINSDKLGDIVFLLVDGLD